MQVISFSCKIFEKNLVFKIKLFPPVPGKVQVLPSCPLQCFVKVIDIKVRFFLGYLYPVYRKVNSDIFLAHHNNKLNQ